MEGQGLGTVCVGGVCACRSLCACECLLALGEGIQVLGL